MKIERLRCIGFGKLRNREIVFDPEKVNLLVEENEFGKSTIIAAIVAALYGFPPRERTTSATLSEKEAYRPDDGGPYQVSLEVRALGTRLRIFRDFARGIARVYNLDEGGREITEEFVRQQKEIGEVLLGLSRDQFLNTCLVRQAVLHAPPDLSDLSAHLQRIADAEAGDRTAAEAMDALKKALEQFPASRMGKGSLHIETEFKRTKDELDKITEELKDLERKRQQIEPQLLRIQEIEREIEDARRRQQLAHYLRERAEYERLQRLQEQREALEAERHRLQQACEALAPYETFPAAQLANLERWMGALRQIAHERAEIEKELNDGHRRYVEIQQEEKALGALASFTSEDRERLIALAEQYKELQERIHQQQQKVHIEQQKLAERGFHLEEFERWHERVGALEPEERRRVLDANAHRRDLERRIEFAEDQKRKHLAVCEEIERERERWRQWAGRWLLLIQLGIFPYFMATILEWGRVSVILSLLIVLWFGLWLFFRRIARTHRRYEWTRAQAEADRLRQEIESLRAECAHLEAQLRPLLARTSLDSGEALAQACAQLETLTAALHPLFLEQAALREYEHELQQKQDLLRALLNRAGRSSAELTLAEIEQLGRDLDRLLDLKRERALLEQRLAHARARRDSKQQEEQKYREQILALFREARVLDLAETNLSVEDLEAASKRFRDGVAQHERLQQVRRELERVQRDLKKLPELAALHERRERTAHSLRRREAEDPTLASHTPDRPAEEYAAEADQWSAQERALRDELLQLRTQIAATLAHLEKRRPELLEREEELARHLKRIEGFQKAIQRALEVFEQIAHEIHGQWADALTQISQELLQTLPTDYAALYFDPRTLELRVALKERESILQTNQFRSQLSLGTREQLGLIARIAVSRYLSRDRRLPLIFDEPFANSDDERFAQLMRLLLSDLSREHQIILTSCHRQRHEWFKTQDPHLFAERVHWCELRFIKVP